LWAISSSISNTVVYSQGQIIVADGVTYRVLADITETENTVIPEENLKLEITSVVFQNLKTGIQYRWDASGQWYKSFEGEYASGFWRLELDPA